MAVLEAGERKVGRLVHYVTSGGKVRPAVITSLGAGNLVDLRVGRHGETYSGIDLMVNSDDVNVWYAGSRRRFPHS